MPNTSKNILQGQNLIDMCLQETGSIENLVEMAYANNRSITTDLAIDGNLEVPRLSKQSIVDFLSANRPATAWNYNDTITPPAEGISYWAINISFEVTEETS